MPSVLGQVDETVPEIRGGSEKRTLLDLRVLRGGVARAGGIGWSLGRGAGAEDRGRDDEEPDEDWWQEPAAGVDCSAPGESEAPGPSGIFTEW